jgi:hypothetical protein
VEQLQAEIKRHDERIDDRDEQLVQMSEALTHLKRWINLERLSLEDTQTHAFLSSLQTAPKTRSSRRFLPGGRLGAGQCARIATTREMLEFRDLWKMRMLDRSRHDVEVWSFLQRRDAPHLFAFQRTRTLCS